MFKVNNKQIDECAKDVKLTIKILQIHWHGSGVFNVHNKPLPVQGQQ